jgi:RNA polymerase-binding transcription factor DksA
MPKTKSAKASAKSKKASPARAAKRTAKSPGKPAATAKAKPRTASKARPTGKPAKNEKPAKTVKPAKAAKPATPAKAAKPAKPLKAEKPPAPPAPRPAKAPKEIAPTHAPVETINGRPGSNDSKPAKVDSKFLARQRERLLQLRDGLLDSMSGVAKDTLRSRAEGSEASAFGMHQADAGSDAYDRDFALSLLSQEQDALYEIEEALKRIEAGTYGICEMSGKPIAHARLEALPFARYTVECQAQVEKQRKVTRSRTPVTSLFGLTDDDSDDSEDEEPTPAESKEDKD